MAVTKDVTKIREASKQSYLGWFDALLEKREEIARIPLEELNKLSLIGRAADNNCCNGSTGFGTDLAER